VFKCYFCQGKTEIKNVDVDFRWGNKLFVIQDVPVELCIQCGERYYSAEVSKNPLNTLEVPVFNWQ